MTTLPLLSTNFIIRNYNTVALGKERNDYEKIVNGGTPSYEDTYDVFSRIINENKLISYNNEDFLNYCLGQSTSVLNQFEKCLEINSRILELIETESDIIGNLNTSFTNNIIDELSSLTNVLNSKSLGKTTLSGSFDNNSATVDLTKLSSTDNTFSPDTSYYTGGKSYSIQIGDNTVTIDTAENSAIQATIAAARMCLGARNKNEIRGAIDLLINANTYLYPRVIENAAHNIKVINEEKGINKANVVELNNMLQNIVNETIETALFKLSEIEYVLETSNSINAKYISRVEELLNTFDRI